VTGAALVPFLSTLLLLAGPLLSTATRATTSQKLVASDGMPGDEFGYSVSVSGNIAVIGAYHDDELGVGAGAAYVFRFNGSAWIQEACPETPRLSRNPAWLSFFVSTERTGCSKAR
jgi:hypothetical protein